MKAVRRNPMEKIAYDMRNSFATFVVCPLLFLAIQITFLWAFVLPAASEDISRQEIQAALIIKFTDFIEWPEESFAHQKSNKTIKTIPEGSTEETKTTGSVFEDGKHDAEQWFTIIILGDNEYEGLFAPFADRLFQNKKLRVLHYPDSGKLIGTSVNDKRASSVSDKRETFVNDKKNIFCW
ncbi:hypothetical protein MTBBW1_1270038 [Desulfamplus magnetovallimortis]|uniref:Uncharacterized protein n=1 Tax=Desulfamplus magnetovallimortis TaxID=1246637 RepID=A0A1W1H726_9BACT|nr:hypothetical protein [Desulfamplus magnetovallimortis]SLM28188.1 hypothetical protein MTBBW1_1270038 [Desulfamplus magnetovallimortis]